MPFFPKFPSLNENSEGESNAMSQLIYLHLSKSAFLVSFTAQNKQLPNLKSVFRFLNCGFSVKEIIRFITFLGTEVLLFVKQCPLKFYSGNKCQSKKVGANFMSYLVILTISFFLYFVRFPQINPSGATRRLSVFCTRCKC